MLAHNRSVLNREWTNNYSEGLGFDCLCVQSPCNLIEDYTEILYIIYEGNVLSIQCKMRLRCIFLRIWPSLHSVAYRQVSSAKRAR
jgi:hypothetical protein